MLNTAIALALMGGARGYGSMEQASMPQVKPRVLYPPKPRTTRAPGILDRIQTCESREAAFLMLHEFLDTANSVSQKTINKANRLLQTLDFPQA